MDVHLIWAQNQVGIIGKNNKIPWHIKEDLNNFKKLTTGHPIIMGRKTWDSLPFKPLPKRRNIVLSKNKLTDIEYYNNIQDCLSVLKTEKIDTIYIIGGRMIYKLFFSIAKFLHITIIDDLDIKGDTFIPFTFSDINHHFKEKNRKKLSKKAEYILFKRI